MSAQPYTIKVYIFTFLFDEIVKFCAGMPYQAHVSAAKAGVDALSAVLAIEEGPNGIRSNVIAPGPIADTEGIDRLTLKDNQHVAHPVGREGVVGDIANATVFLFSHAAAYITGQVIPVDGGTWHLMSSLVPYPSAVIDPKGFMPRAKSKL